MAEQEHQEPSATEKIIIATSKVINKIENLDPRTVPSPAPNLDFPFPPDSRQAYEIFNNLENLILFADDDEDDFPFMPVLDDISHLAIVSQSVLAYIKTISPGSRLMKVSNKIYTQATKWITSMFLNESVATFLPTSADCLSKALRLALSWKFENYVRDGIHGIKSSSIYISSSNPYMPDLKFAVHLIGLPQSSIKMVPCIEGTETMDIAEFEKQVTSTSSESVQLFLCADLGSSFCGGVDGTLTELTSLSQKYGLWLHLSGPLVASLTLANQESENITKNISSMTLDLESWLGIPSVPTVLLHRHIAAAHHQTVFEIESDMRKLEAFPLWTVFQSIGRDKIIRTFEQAFQSSRILYELVSKTKGFRMLSKRPITLPNEIVTDADTTKESPFTIESFTPIVVFQFDGSNLHNDGTNNMELIKKTIEKINNASYFDRLNSWLGQTLERDFPQVQLSLMEHPIFGTCIRFSPFELSTGEKVPALDIFTDFYEFFEAQSDILCATIEKKQTFNEMVERSSVLKLVQLSDDWAGLGGVHYVPENLLESIETDQGKTELNKLNMELVDKLRSSDNAFSLGESTDGVACIRFGMVTSETDIEELLDLVISAGNALQESSKALDTMAEIIKKGIQAAQIDLQRENDEKVWQDGIFRVVPVVGSVLNWINPLPKDGGSGIRGRSLNLTQGVVESTENIYKYHMQLPLNPPSTGSNSHSRNESQSSTNSKQGPASPAPEEPKLNP